MECNIRTCAVCFQSSLNWHYHHELEEIRSKTSTWPMHCSSQESLKLNEMYIPEIFKDFSVNANMENYTHVYQNNNWNNDWNYMESSNYGENKKIFIDQNRDCISGTESDDYFRCHMNTYQHSDKDGNQSNNKFEDLLSSLKESTGFSDISSIVDSKEEIQQIQKQNLTFTSPESAFYDYQQKMENQLCQVCQESAAGFHHGAYVCEACKKFFMRHNLNCTKFNIPCPTRGQCAQIKPGRIKCQSCRFKKCISIGMTFQNPGNNNSKFDISKIPCRVCGGKSSGFHFGALTCEGCKGFFRRTESTSRQLICVTGGNKCSLTGSSSRNLCKSCRFKRCIEVGMSKKGSRIGRQPNAVKFHCILEIMQRDQNKNISNSENFNGSSQKPVFINTYSNSHHMPTKPQTIKSMNSKLFKLKTKIINLKETDLFYNSEELFLFENSIKEANRIIELSKTNLQELRSNHFSEKNFKLNDLWKYMMNNFDVHSAMIVQFVKTIPGFNKFELKYRRALVQDAMYPIILLRLALDYKAETDEYNYFDFSCTDRQVILLNFKSFHKLTEHLLKISRMVYSLNLSSYSISLLCVIELMKNFEYLANPGEAKRILDQSKYLLWNYIEVEESEVYTHYNEDSNTNICTNLIPILPRKSFQRYQMIFQELPKLLSQMNMEHLKVVQELKSFHPELIFPELYMDIFNIQDTKPHCS